MSGIIHHVKEARAIAHVISKPGDRTRYGDDYHFMTTENKYTVEGVTDVEEQIHSRRGNR